MIFLVGSHPPLDIAVGKNAWSKFDRATGDCLALYRHLDDVVFPRMSGALRANNEAFRSSITRVCGGTFDMYLTRGQGVSEVLDDGTVRLVGF